MGDNNIMENDQIYPMIDIPDEDHIDYILVRKNEDTEHLEDIQIFEANLRLAGLRLEQAEVLNDGTVFIKIFADEKVLKHFCTVMKIRMPLNVEGQDCVDNYKSRIKRIYEFFIQFGYCGRILPKKDYKLTKEFSGSREALFNIADENFFTLSVRSMIVNYILRTTKFTNEEITESKRNVGIYKLVARNAYEAAYTVHAKSKREILLNEWASMRNFFQLQPLDEIKDYLGIKIALYYTWVAFYTRMLIPAAFVGVLCMLHGIITYNSRKYKFETCNVDLIMCPLCDKHCDFWEIKDSCIYSIITYVFDNSSTILFAIFMTLWSAVYLNIWKRFSAEIVHRWGMTSDALKNENLTVDDRFKYNMNRIPRYLFSISIVLFWVAIVMAFILALMFYRISLTTSEHIFGENSATITKLFVNITGSILDFISILILNYIYQIVALWLTRREKHRTQTDFENSLTWKIYLFWFVNYYSALFYIAFIKGRFGGHPGAYIRLLGYRQEECGPGGCMLELFIQLAVLMIGDITFNNFLEYVVPFVQRKYQSNKNILHVNEEAEGLDNIPQYQQDYKLLEWKTTDMLYEYLDMVLQYGFVTLFVTAFPLAPLFALVNNIFEVRWDATKLLVNYRRPVAQNAKDIGMWLSIMDFISNCAILSNACIIAFTSNFIPQLVYTLRVSPNTTAAGFLNYSLSYFDVQHFENNTSPRTTKYNITQCRYPDYRNPPGHEKEYEITMFYWHVLVARLCFVVLFQNVIVVLKMIMKWLVPEMPRNLKEHILEETEKIHKLMMDERRNQTRTDYY